ncbi:hypothetical protein [Hyphomicrobium nitrativorans]|nr:hypothetical protein [Hyphomicrobium nitrativorans]
MPAMSRTDAINAIAKNLPRLREDELATLVAVTTAWAQPERTVSLTPAERDAVERSRKDFAAGRTLTLDEAEARTDEYLAARRAARNGE